MLEHDRTDVSEGTVINKIDNSPEYIVCHYWFFLGANVRFQPKVCDKCHMTQKSRSSNDAIILTQPTFTCSKLAIETLEQSCEICSKLTIKPPKRRQWYRFGGFIVNFEHISHLCSSVSVVNVEHVIAGWVLLQRLIIGLVFEATIKFML